jgi:hypothetical protein
VSTGSLASRGSLWRASLALQRVQVFCVLKIRPGVGDFRALRGGPGPREHVSENVNAQDMRPPSSGYKVEKSKPACQGGKVAPLLRSRPPVCRQGHG